MFEIICTLHYLWCDNSTGVWKIWVYKIQLVLVNCSKLYETAEKFENLVCSLNPDPKIVIVWMLLYPPEPLNWPVARACHLSMPINQSTYPERVTLFPKYFRCFVDWLSRIWKIDILFCLFRTIRWEIFATCCQIQNSTTFWSLRVQSTRSFNASHQRSVNK